MTLRSNVAIEYLRQTEGRFLVLQAEQSQVAARAATVHDSLLKAKRVKHLLIDRRDTLPAGVHLDRRLVKQM